MKRETWKMWTWCALVLSIATVGANVFMAFYPNQKDTTPNLTPDKIDKLCAEKGWFHVPSSAQNKFQQSFYLTKDNKPREYLISLPVSCKETSKWKGAILVHDYTGSSNTTMIFPDGGCHTHFANYGKIYLFGDDTMIRDMMQYFNHP